MMLARIATLGMALTFASALWGAEYVDVTLKMNRPLYCLKPNNVLSVVKNLSKGSAVSIPKNAIPLLYNLESGQRDTSGFYSDVQTANVSMPSRCQKAKGFFITALVPIHDGEGIIAALPLVQTPKASFQKVYNSSGKVRIEEGTIAWGIGRNKKRFKTIWNKTIPIGEISSEDLAKSQAVLEELKNFANRTIETPASLVYLSEDSGDDLQSIARALSLQTINEYGFSPAYGAWDVAIYGTATRLGFAHAPCAEFMSEVIRQAYARAGYSHDEDFAYTIRDRLIFTPWQNDIYGPQAVRGLADRLANAGWIPWDPSVYKPALGAIGMALDAWTPGHTYIMAGLNGQFIVDNGNPRGLDLRLSSLSLSRFKDMYGHGVFFLPPGITPEKW